MKAALMGGIIGAIVISGILLFDTVGGTSAQKALGIFLFIPYAIGGFILGAAAGFIVGKILKYFAGRKKK